MKTVRAGAGPYREAIAALDFVAVPAVTFRLLYCFFAIHHGRRKILHFNAPGGRRQAMPGF
ncbi:MAG: hypothetical protein ACLQGV_11705 [Bryobacteraceae bacterium]